MTEINESGDAQPISMVVVTMSLGAVILLMMLVFGIGRVASKEEEEHKGMNNTRIVITVMVSPRFT